MWAHRQTGHLEEPRNIHLTKVCEFTPEKHDLGDGKPPLKGEMWFQVTDQPVFPIAGFWQCTKGGQRVHDGDMRPEQPRRADPRQSNDHDR